MENESEGQWRVETGGGDGSETGSVTEEEKNDDRDQCQPHPGLQGLRGEHRPQLGPGC